jgi:hypothetical protein
VQRQHVVVGAQGDEVLAVVEGEAADPRLARAPQGLVQQPVGLGRVARAGVVGAVVEDRVDGGSATTLPRSPAAALTSSSSSTTYLPSLIS